MKVALFGFGYWGKKIHSILKNDLNFECIVVDPGYSDNDSFFVKKDFVLNDSSISHCFIATPEETHYSLTRECLNASKHVFVEKPLALKKKHADELLHLSLKNNKLLYVDYIFLFDPQFQKIKEMVRDSSIGEILYVESIRKSVDISKDNIGVVEDLSIHDLYIYSELFGSTIKHDFSIHTFSISHEHTDVATIFCEIGNSIVCKCSYSWIAPKKQRTLTIYGSNGILVWDREVEDSIIFHDIKDDEITEKKYLNTVINFTHSPLQKSIQLFLDKSNKAKTIEWNRRYSEYLEHSEVLEIMVNSIN